MLILVLFSMKSLPDQEEQIINSNVQRIWEDIVYSMDQYTSDGTRSRFYSPEEILKHCHTAASIFTQLLYVPIPTIEETKKTRLHAMIYLAMTCGVQIFLKERSLSKGHLPYKVNQDEKAIRHARNKIGKALSEGIKVKPPVSQVMELFIAQLDKPHYVRKFALRGREFNSEKFESLLPAAIMWGYLLAQELIVND